MPELVRPLKQGQWSESALRVLRERYLDKGKEVGPDGRILNGKPAESPEDMCWRVATAIAAAEATWGKTQEQIHEVASRFYELMVDGVFLPNSPTLMNAGKNNGLQYSACFVLPVGDSMDQIFEAVKRAAIIHKSGGGTGFQELREDSERPCGNCPEGDAQTGRAQARKTTTDFSTARGL